MTISQGYEVIKGVSKKKEDIIKKFRTMFVEGCVHNGVPQEVAEQYWDKFIVPFAAYGFNAAHSCCYAYNSYITAYLKANFPEEFMVSYLNVECVRRKLERVAVLESEVRKMGITLLPRDINKSSLKYEIIKKKDPTKGIPKSEIRPAIHCKNLSFAAAENLVKNAPYSSIVELAKKVDLSIIDKESVVALCDAGFFKTKKDKLVEDFEIIRDDIRKLRKKGRESEDMMEGL